MARFFLPPSEWAAPAWELRGDEAHHAAKVLRLQQGDSCIVFDGCGRAAHAVVAEPPRSSGVLLVPGEECPPSPPVAHLTLCQAVPKGANMDLIIQKSVELGVSAIVPLVTDRTIVRLNAREAEAKRQKWQRIALEACKQCGQNTLPKVALPGSLCGMAARRNSGRTEYYRLSGARSAAGQGSAGGRSFPFRPSRFSAGGAGGGFYGPGDGHGVGSGVCSRHAWPYRSPGGDGRLFRPGRHAVRPGLSFFIRIPMFKNIIFDWSGTLVDDLALTLDASNYVFSQYGKPCMNRDEFRAEFQLPYPDYYARVLPHADLDELEDHFRYAFRVSNAPVEVLPNAREFLEFCRARGVRCFILTSVDAKEFDTQCRELGMMEYFEAIHAGIRHKDAHIHTLLAQHGLHAHETAFIGDMQHDVETAHHAGITSIAVLTGYNDAAQLSKAKPDMIVPDLLVLRTLMRRYALPSDTQDSININGLELDTFIGVPDEERASMQTLKADITFYPEEALSGLNDDFSRTVCYDSMARALRAEAMARPRKLVETLAEDMGKVCLKEFGARHVVVTLRKFILPRTDSVSVTVHVSRHR